MSEDYAALPQLLNRRLDNSTKTVFASAARTTTVTSDDFIQYGARGMIVFFDVTAASLTPSVTCQLLGVDEVSGNTTSILTSDAATGVVTKVMRIHPALTATTNIAKDFAPKKFRFTMTASDTDSLTYSVSYQLILV